MVNLSNQQIMKNQSNDYVFGPANWEDVTFGDISNVFGDSYKIYKNRRVSRLPNGDLMCLHRVKEIVAKWHDFNQPAYIISEFDVNDDAWYLNPKVPFFILQESALQPCGFLSAYMGSPLLHPENDYYFRNLDGHITILNDMDIRGKTITTHAILDKHLEQKETIIQRFTFSQSCDGKPFLEGESVFGYFSKGALSANSGLAHLKERLPEFSQIQPSSIHYVPFQKELAGKTPLFPVGKAYDLNKIMINSNGNDNGTVYGSRLVQQEDWFFKNHFHEDPVMPGSLGVETIYQCLRAFAIQNKLTSSYKQPHFGFKNGGLVKWKYRGQILQTVKELQVEVNIQKIETHNKKTIISATGIVWADQTAIYEVKNAEIQIQEGILPMEKNKANTLPHKENWQGPIDSISFNQSEFNQKIKKLSAPIFIIKSSDEQIGITHEGHFTHSNLAKDGSHKGLGSSPAINIEQLGNQDFKNDYNLTCAYMGGAMANGISSIEMVSALGNAGCLGSFGAAGMIPSRLEKALNELKATLPNGNYAVNLIHSPSEDLMEQKAVELFEKYDTRIVEASAFIRLSPSIIAYRAAGLSTKPDGEIVIKNKVIAKLSRTEVAKKFMQPAAEKTLRKLVEDGRITEEQASLALHVPMADDITVEADSGGHTDNRPLVCLLPTMLALRDEMQEKYQYKKSIRVGAGGGISTPASALAAFMMGAAYIVTGSVNQGCIEAGVSEYTRNQLAKAKMTDVLMSPAADMFEMGVRVQVLKTGTLFPMRAHKLYELYSNYESIDHIPAEEREKIEKNVFRRGLEEVWKDTVSFFSERDPAQIERAMDNPKRKMSLIFRWYLGLSSKWACDGLEGREMDYQIWCGPAMGTFNDWVRGTYLELPENRRVADVALHILTGAAYLYRLQSLSFQGFQIPSGLASYLPQEALI
ncbi:MAG: PfaD family polyunsaturated fatty acid/polyketide biosynthesis protein [Anaerolineaceae bacterium]|nr:PfaD family polyunsaturated fatty acid/polyketide biosynthesis protein [Anaerolineaceae bacterium]